MSKFLISKTKFLFSPQLFKSSKSAQRSYKPYTELDDLVALEDMGGIYYNWKKMTRLVVPEIKIDPDDEANIWTELGGEKMPENSTDKNLKNPVNENNLKS